jgi:hypothetical protein
MTEPHKDFLALTHGEEWVNFYESFDKLVQDNLSRSSDLLKKAMTLPEVADREVAKVKAEHETKLADERNRQRATLAGLRDEVTTTHLQVSALTRNMASLMADLERLTGKITTAIASIETPAEARPQTAPLAEARPQTSSLPPMPEPAAPVIEAVAPVVEETTPEPAPTAAQAAPEPMVAEAVPAAEEPASIDLSAMAAAEDTVAPEPPAAPTAPAMPMAGELTGAANGAGERQRPHWLSVTRIGSSGSN